MRLYCALTGLVVLGVAAGAWAQTAEELLGDLRSPDVTKQLSAAISLGNSPKWGKVPEALEALAGMLNDPEGNARVRAACARALGKQKVVQLYDKFKEMSSDKGEKPIVQAACVEAMGDLKGAESIKDIVEVLKLETSQVIADAAIRSLAFMGEPEAVAPAVTPLLDDEKAARKAIRVLGDLRHPIAVEPLAKQFESSKTTIRIAVIQALSRIKSPTVIPPLMKYYQDTRVTDIEKIQIISVFENRRDLRTVPLLMEDFRNAKTYPAVRRSAAITLGKMQAKEAIDPMIAVLMSVGQDTGFRKVCAKALGYYTLDDDKVIRSLIGALADARVDIQRSCAISLSQITGRYLGEDKTRWETWYTEEYLKRRPKS